MHHKERLKMLDQRCVVFTTSHVTVGVFCCLARRRALIFCWTQKKLSPNLHISCLDLFYFKCIHYRVDSWISMWKQNANIESYVWYSIWSMKVNDDVHNVNREPADYKKSQDQRQRRCKLFFFPQVCVWLILSTVTCFFFQSSMNETEYIAVQNNHH